MPADEDDPAIRPSRHVEGEGATTGGRCRSPLPSARCARRRRRRGDRRGAQYAARSSAPRLEAGGVELMESRRTARKMESRRLARVDLGGRGGRRRCGRPPPRRPSVAGVEGGGGGRKEMWWVVEGAMGRWGRWE
jgi:hypothetical protein